MWEAFVGRLRSRAVFVNELRTSALDFQPSSRQTRTANFAYFLLIQYTQQRHTQISSSYNKRRYLHITALKAEAEEKVQFLQFAIVMHEAVYLTYVLFQSYSAFQSWRS